MKRNFFYKKNKKSKTVRKNCFWIELANKKYLVSYQTIVCSVDENGRFEKYWNDYSVTTLNQINRFLEMLYEEYGIIARDDKKGIIAGFSKKEWEGMETTYLNIVAYDKIKPFFPDIEWNDRNDYVAKITY